MAVTPVECRLCAAESGLAPAGCCGSADGAVKGGAEGAPGEAADPPPRPPSLRALLASGPCPPPPPAMGRRSSRPVGCVQSSKQARTFSSTHGWFQSSVRLPSRLSRARAAANRS